MENVTNGVRVNVDLPYPLGKPLFEPKPADLGAAKADVCEPLPDLLVLYNLAKV